MAWNAEKKASFKKKCISGMELFWAMTLQIFWPKPGNPREGGTNGREGGGGEGGSRAKPGNQLVKYILDNVISSRIRTAILCDVYLV